MTDCLSSDRVLSLVLLIVISTCDVTVVFH